MNKVDFFKTLIGASFYTNVVRKYWFKCYKWDFRHKR